MNGLSLGAPFTAASQLLSQGSTYVGRLLTDPSLLTLSESSFGKAAGYINRATQASQMSAFRFLINKNVAGSYDSKPTGRVVMATLEEGAHLLGRFAPQLTRGGFSPAMIGIICATGLATLMADDTVRQMTMDQINNMTAFWQNDNAETNNLKSEESTPPTPTAEITHLNQRPSHNNFTI